MATKSTLCALLALLCAVALLSSVRAAEDVVEARNDEAAVELPQPQADKVLSDPLPVKTDLSGKPVELENKTKSEQSAPLAEAEIAAYVAEDSEKESFEQAVNAEVLKQPHLARLARHLKSFHNYQEFRAQKSAGLQQRNIDEDDVDADIIPQGRAIRRRKRVRRRNQNNNLRRTHRRSNVASRRQSTKRRNQSALRRPGVKKPVNRLRVKNSKSRRGSSNKKSYRRKNYSSNRQRSKKRSSSKNKRKSLKKNRRNKNQQSGHKETEGEQDEDADLKKPEQASEMIAVVDIGPSETVVVAPAA